MHTNGYEWPLTPKFMARFWSRVEVKSREECWLWLGRARRGGYGYITRSIDDKRLFVAAHRLSLVIARAQPIPSGKLVLHHCDNRLCVNPHHLYVGTYADNARDAVERGRMASPFPLYGEENPVARLTQAKADEIRAAHASGASRAELEAKFGVSKTTVAAVVRGERW